MAEAKVWPQYVAGLSAAGGALSCGAVIGWSSPVQEELEHSDNYGFQMSSDEFSWVGSLMTLGAATVCIPTGFLIKILGRKWTMLLMVIPFCIGWALVILAQNAYMMMVARFLLGMAGGAFCVASPIYSTEIATKEIRGIIGSFFQLLLTAGVLLGYLLGTAFKAFVFSIACAFVPIIFAIIFFFMPESPMYLVAKGNIEGAQKSMEWLRGKDYNSSAEIAEWKASDQKVKDNRVPLGKALCQHSTLKPMGLSIALMILQQFSGINAIIFYSSDVFKSAGGTLSPTVSTIIVGVMLFGATVVSLFIIDRFGRLPLLHMAWVSQAISTFIMGIYFFMKDNDAKSVESISWLPILSVVIFILMFSVGFGPVPWIFMAEVFPEDVKDIGSSICGTTNWLSAFAVTKLFPVTQELIGKGPAFWIFSVVSIIGGVFIFFCIPETKGKTFAEIQAELGAKGEGKAA